MRIYTMVFATLGVLAALIMPFGNDTGHSVISADGCENASSVASVTTHFDNGENGSDDKGEASALPAVVEPESRNVSGMNITYENPINQMNRSGFISVDRGVVPGIISMPGEIVDDRMPSTIINATDGSRNPGEDGLEDGNENQKIQVAGNESGNQGEDEQPEDGNWRRYLDFDTCVQDKNGTQVIGVVKNGYTIPTTSLPN